MPTLKITTSQNVVIDYELATVLERVVGGLFDVFVQFVYTLLLSITYASSQLEYDWTFLVFWLPVLTYSLLFDTFFNGRTPGKMLFGVRVISIDGKRAGFTSFFIRWGFRIFDVYLTAGSLAIASIFFNKKAQRSGDIAASTAVVKIKPRPIYNPLSIYVPKNYQIKWPNVKLLTEQDVQIISELLQHYRITGTSFKMNEIMNKTRKKIENITGAEAQLKPDKFLQAVLTDYAAIHSNLEKETPNSALPF